ncbi:hypothetical protein PPEP_a3788 [Pseudoalteromonas peptidolytica F12-50-A1]|uniref:Uncharacterized protein n=1 Tax=Pseudoalteromonas peptidolytica F12-50-A1 TaxID=1315280 RepID=A0A8I0MVF8_9GAMM|nr:hypothetical protein [Pseudoalteromonas peptidolytica F12-50-A1]
MRLAMGLALFDHKLAKSAIPPCPLELVLFITYFDIGS